MGTFISDPGVRERHGNSWKSLASHFPCMLPWKAWKTNPFCISVTERLEQIASDVSVEAKHLRFSEYPAASRNSQSESPTSSPSSEKLILETLLWNPRVLVSALNRQSKWRRKDTPNLGIGDAVLTILPSCLFLKFCGDMKFRVNGRSRLFLLPCIKLTTEGAFTILFHQYLCQWSQEWMIFCACSNIFRSKLSPMTLDA